MKTNATSKLPLGLSIEVPDILDGELVLDFSLKRNAKLNDIAALIEIMDLYQRCVNQQLFWVREESTWKGEWSPLTEGRISYNAKVFGLQAIFLRILVQLIAQCVYSEEPIVGIRMSVEGLENAGQNANQILNSRLGSESSLFEEAGELDISKGDWIRIVFHFCEDISEELLEKVSEGLHLWNHLVFMGGFDDPCTIQDDFCIAIGDSTKYDNVTIIHVLERFMGGASCLQFLGSCFGKHLQTQGLIRIETL